MYNEKLSILSPLYITLCNCVVYEADYQIPAAGGRQLVNTTITDLASCPACWMLKQCNFLKSNTT